MDIENMRLFILEPVMLDNDGYKIKEEDRGKPKNA